MAYSITKIGGFGRPLLYREFLIDTIDDISSLPVTGISPGSNAYCVEENSRYIFTNNKEWEILEDGGGSDLPEVTADDKDKYLHTNSSTGDLEWSAVSGGGGVFVINTTPNGSGLTMDKTFAEIQTAMSSMPVVVNSNGYLGIVNNVVNDDRYKTVNVVVSVSTGNTVNWSNMSFTTGSADGYPSVTF